MDKKQREATLRVERNLPCLKFFNPLEDGGSLGELPLSHRRPLGCLRGDGQYLAAYRRYEMPGNPFELTASHAPETPVKWSPLVVRKYVYIHGAEFIWDSGGSFL